MRARILFPTAMFLLTVSAYAQMVGAFADVTVCDVPGTNQVVANGVHAVDEFNAPQGHSHFEVKVLGTLRKYTTTSRCAQDFGFSTADSCVKAFTEVNGETACSTFSGGQCTSHFRARAEPVHIPLFDETENQGPSLSPCATADCLGDPGCSPFRDYCF